MKGADEIKMIHKDLILHVTVLARGYLASLAHVHELNQRNLQKNLGIADHDV